MSDTNVQLVLNSRDRTAGQYNASKYNAIGQNIIQGNIKQITVQEVNFPYDIPNVQAGNSLGIEGTEGAQYNTFYFINGTAGLLVISITPGFYSGAELETAITAEILAVGAAQDPVLTPDLMPSFTYDETNNIFTLNAPTTTTGSYLTWDVFSPYILPLSGRESTGLGKDLLTIMGFSRPRDGIFDVTSNPAITAIPNFRSGGSAPLVFTQYIDICSPQLCRNQYLSDGSTTNLARRSDVVCRLFVSNNVAIQEPEGLRPFIINRQYVNARVMRWTTDSAIGSMDINLYDDVGQPLLTTWEPRPFQITFNCHENAMREGF